MRGQVEALYTVYDSPNRELVIPVYQRNYDWQQTQCEQLLDDLADLARSGRDKHFFGSIVGDPEDSWTWVVIDGQQRLTTVSILILALSNLSDAGALVDPQPPAGFGERLRSSYLLGNDDKNQPKFRLKPVKDDADAYRRLFGPESEYIESSNITANYRFFMERLPALRLSAQELWRAICGLEVMHLNLDKEDDPQRIFESLNSTGLELTEADKVRNLVLMGLESKDQEWVYEDYWNRIEKNVHFETDAFLRWYLVTQISRTPRRDAVYDEFKAYSKRLGSTGADLLERVRRFSQYYRQLLDGDTGIAAADSRLKRLNILKQDVVLPMLMLLLDEYHNGTVSAEDFSRSIEIVDSFLVRRFVSGYATNALNKIFATLHKDVRTIRGEDDDFSDVLAYLLLRRTGSGYFPDDDMFEQDFVTRDFYHIRPDRRRHIFECLENGLSHDRRDIAGFMEEGKLSVEHIMPQTLTKDWQEMLGENAVQVHQEWLHTIGNLTVTGYNSTYSNQPFEVKRTTENGLGASPYRLNLELQQAEKWTEEEITARAKRLADNALMYWPYPHTTFEPPAVELPQEPLGDSEPFTNRRVVAYEFLQGQRTVRTWKELVLNVLQELAILDRSALISAAENHPFWFRIDGKTQAQGGTFDHVTSGVEVVLDTSTSSRVNFLRRLFERLDIDPDELTLFFSSTDQHAQDDLELDLEDSPHADLLKFIPVLREIAELKTEPTKVANLVHELAEQVQKLDVSQSPLEILGVAPAEFVSTPQRIQTARDIDILALLVAKLKEQELYNPQAIEIALKDGSILTWLQRLKEVSIK